MPSGVPVATVALNGAKNAGILAAQIIGASDKAVGERIGKFKKDLQTKVDTSIRELRIAGFENSFDQD
jgi:5-(carboxyamino)imidazole ribonucleotide mutase